MSRGSAMHTSQGEYYYPFDPRPEEVNIETIAHHLATRCRYNGATAHPNDPSRIFYSVAEHSVYVAWCLEEELGRPDLALAGLLHDGSEAYNGDLIRPLKYSEEFREPFKKVEELNEVAVARRFQIEYPFAKEVKVADEMVGLAEMEQIIKAPMFGNINHFNAPKAAKIQIAMYDPFYAKQMFLREYERLTQHRADAV